MAVPLYFLGQLAATPGPLALLADAGENPAEFPAPHQSGDRGAVPPEDARESEGGVYVACLFLQGRARRRSGGVLDRHQAEDPADTPQTLLVNRGGATRIPRVT